MAQDKYAANSLFNTRPPAYGQNVSHPHEHQQELRAKQEAREQLSQAVGDSQEVLASATTVFPFTLFPDTVTIDRTKLSVAHRSFFKVAEAISIRVEDVLNVTANVGPFFGSLSIATRFFDNKKPYEIHYLWREDALRIKRIMQGYLIAAQKEVDVSALSNKELATLLDELGKDES